MRALRLGRKRPAPGSGHAGPALLAAAADALPSGQGGGSCVDGSIATGLVRGLPEGGFDALSAAQYRALEQLQAWAVTLRDREGWAWVDVALVFDATVWQAYRDAPTLSEVHSEDMAETLRALERQRLRLERLWQRVCWQSCRGRTPPLRAAQRARIELLESQCLRYGSLIEELRARQRVCPPELAAWVGVLIAFDRRGRLLIRRHLLRRRDLLRVPATRGGSPGA